MPPQEVMIEGGGKLSFSALQAGIVDKVVTFIAPRLLGGKDAPTPVGGEGFQAMEEALEIRDLKMKKIGDDYMLEGYPVSHDQKIK